MGLLERLLGQLQFVRAEKDHAEIGQRVEIVRGLCEDLAVDFLGLEIVAALKLLLALARQREQFGGTFGAPRSSWNRRRRHPRYHHACRWMPGPKNQAWAAAKILSAEVEGVLVKGLALASGPILVGAVSMGGSGRLRQGKRQRIVRRRQWRRFDRLALVLAFSTIRPSWNCPLPSVNRWPGTLRAWRWRRGLDLHRRGRHRDRCGNRDGHRHRNGHRRRRSGLRSHWRGRRHVRSGRRSGRRFVGGSIVLGSANGKSLFR